MLSISHAPCIQGRSALGGVAVVRSSPFVGYNVMSGCRPRIIQIASGRNYRARTGSGDSDRCLTIWHVESGPYCSTIISWIARSVRHRGARRDGTPSFSPRRSCHLNPHQGVGGLSIYRRRAVNRSMDTA